MSDAPLPRKYTKFLVIHAPSDSRTSPSPDEARGAVDVEWVPGAMEGGEAVGTRPDEAAEAAGQAEKPP